MRAGLRFELDRLDPIIVAVADEEDFVIDETKSVWLVE